MKLSVTKLKNGIPRLGLEIYSPPTIFLRLDIKFLYWTFQFNLKEKK